MTTGAGARHHFARPNQALVLFSTAVHAAIVCGRWFVAGGSLTQACIRSVVTQSHLHPTLQAQLDAIALAVYLPTQRVQYMRSFFDLTRSSIPCFNTQQMSCCDVLSDN
jgi:hypothetical protein